MATSRFVLILLAMAASWGSDAFAQATTPPKTGDERPAAPAAPRSGTDQGDVVVYPASKLELKEKKKSERDVKICKNC